MQRGVTLIELMTVLAVAALLAAVSYPRHAASLHKARRADAIGRLASIQQSQENWRADHAGFATSDDLGLASDALGSAYALSIASANPSGYVAIAEARGARFDDDLCRVMRLTVSGGNIMRASGPDATLGNDGPANNRCWLQ